MSTLYSNATERPVRDSRGSKSTPLFIPLLLLMVAWLLWSGFQSMQLLTERSQLEDVHANQQRTVITAEQMRAQLDALATGTNQLANSGHPHATYVVQELARQGVTINSGAIE